jgi:hypothetical protein
LSCDLDLFDDRIYLIKGLLYQENLFILESRSINEARCLFLNMIPGSPAGYINGRLELNEFILKNGRRHTADFGI